MKISNKLCNLGKSIKGHNVHPRPNDGEEEGDAGEPTPGKEIRLTGIPLTRKQVDFLAGEDYFRRNFDDSTKPAKWLNTFRKIPIPTEYVGGSAELQLGVEAKTIALKDAVRIRNIAVKIDEKSSTPTLDCTLQAIFPRKLETLDLENFYGKDITITSLTFGDAEEDDEERQPQLPMETTSTDEGKPIDKTRILTPGQKDAEDAVARELRDRLREADHDRQLDEAARHHERAANGKGETKGDKTSKRTRKPADATAH